MQNKIYLLLLVLLVMFIHCTRNIESSQNLVLRYNEPASVWEESIPLGNGRIGMMPDGGIFSELIVLNDITMWSGSEDPETTDTDAFNYLPVIQDLLLRGNNLDAQNLMYKHFKSGGLGSAFGNGKDAPYGCFQLMMQYLQQSLVYQA